MRTQLDDGVFGALAVLDVLEVKLIRRQRHAADIPEARAVEYQIAKVRSWADEIFEYNIEPQETEWDGQ